MKRGKNSSPGRGGGPPSTARWWRGPPPSALTGRHLPVPGRIWSSPTSTKWTSANSTPSSSRPACRSTAIRSRSALAGPASRSSATSSWLLELVPNNVLLFGMDVSDRQSEWPALQRPHNLQDAACAVAVIEALSIGRAAELGVRDEVVAQGLRTYPGLPHRMERIRECDGV